MPRRRVHRAPFVVDIDDGAAIQKSVTKLTADILKDDEKLGEGIDQVTFLDPKMRKLARAIVRRQRELRRVVGDDVWKAFLRIEEIVNERFAGAVILVARWAFEEGVRARRRS